MFNPLVTEHTVSHNPRPAAIAIGAAAADPPIRSQVHAPLAILVTFFLVVNGHYALI